MRLFFLGLSHHAEKLKPVFDLYDNSVWLMTDNSVNIDPTIPPENDRFFDIRQINIEEPPSLPKFIPRFAPFWFFQAHKELCVFNLRLDRLLSGGKVESCFILHENNFWGKQIAKTCFYRGVPCYSFQEGILRHMDQDILNKQNTAAQYSTKMFVWTEEDKKSYIDAGVDPNKIFVTGLPHITKRKAEIDRNSIGIFMPTPEVYNGNFQDDIKKFEEWAKNNPQKRVRISLHPFMKSAKLNTNWLIPEPSNALYEKSDVALVQHTTCRAEAAAYGMPVIEWNFGSAPFFQDPSEEWVEICSHTDQLSGLIEEASRPSGNFLGDLDEIKRQTS